MNDSQEAKLHEFAQLFWEWTLEQSWCCRGKVYANNTVLQYILWYWIITIHKHHDIYMITEYHGTSGLGDITNIYENYKYTS